MVNEGVTWSKEVAEEGLLLAAKDLDNYVNGRMSKSQSRVHSRGSGVQGFRGLRGTGIQGFRISHSRISSFWLIPQTFLVLKRIRVFQFVVFKKPTRFNTRVSRLTIKRLVNDLNSQVLPWICFLIQIEFQEFILHPPGVTICQNIYSWKSFSNQTKYQPQNISHDSYKQRDTRTRSWQPLPKVCFIRCGVDTDGER